jgi:tight adherence protein C
MTLLLLAIGVLLVGGSVRLMTRAAVLPQRRLKAHLREILVYGFDSPVPEGELSPVERFRRELAVIAERLGGFMMRRVPSFKALRAGDLAAAGIYNLSPEAVHGYRVLSGIAFPSLILLMLLPTGKISGLDMLLLLFSAAAGCVLPSAVIRRRGGARLEEIDRKLPELIDLLIATIEAGMGFTASLSLISDRLAGPLGDELRLTMKQQTLGMSMGQALEDMGERCQTPSLRSFVRTAGRGETLGISIGPVLRELSADQRRRRRQAVREKMLKAPVKMIFPLMFLIMPALMIVLMFPAGYALSHSMSGF